MAGFFGFFNYDKEGPGIAKNAPKKHGFIVFFETLFRNFWKFIPINLVYCLICLPVFTNGFANVGITNVARNTARDKHSFGLPDFFETIKKNKKQSIIAGIINAIFYILLIANGVFYFFIEQSIIRLIGLSITLSILFVFTLMNYFLWTLIITFNYTLKQAYINSFKFVFINLKMNILCFVTNVLVLAALVGIFFLLPNDIVLIIEIMFLLAVYPCFNALLIQFCTFPSIKKYIIDPYYKEHPDEDIEKRHDLGLDIETEEDVDETEEDSEEDDSDVIFED